MLVCCVNCKHYFMDAGFSSSEYTHECERVGCGKAVFEGTLEDSSFIIQKQREITEKGCEKFTPYNEEESQ